MNLHKIVAARIFGSHHTVDSREFNRKAQNVLLCNQQDAKQVRRELENHGVIKPAYRKKYLVLEG